MKLFGTISVEISAQCNRTCAFCPVAYNKRPDEQMSVTVWNKILMELGAAQYSGRIELYIYNEPAKDMHHLIECILQARNLVPRSTIMIATNGDYLRGVENINKLYAAGLNQLLINCYSAGLYAKRLPWLAALPADVSRMKSVYSATGSRSKVVQMLDKSNASTFGTGIFRLTNRAGNIATFLPAVPQPVERMCVRPFRILNINWRGDALVCCQDYHGEVVYGNAATSTVQELWNHPVMMLYRRRLLQRDRTLPLCKSCDCHAGAYPHNVPQPHAPYATKQDVESLQKKVKR
jgi:hypothetical protein